jgi:hypothetical protein
LARPSLPREEPLIHPLQGTGRRQLIALSTEVGGPQFFGEEMRTMSAIERVFVCLAPTVMAVQALHSALAVVAAGKAWSYAGAVAKEVSRRSQ